jgi:hypothetical protein
MKRVITIEDLHARLTRVGQNFHSVGNASPVRTAVWPTPETIVSVGLYPDPTLKPEYRDRYFACWLESEENPVPILQFEGTFDLPELFLAAAREFPAQEDFLDGPFRWLLHRLRKFSQVLFWPEDRGYFSQEGITERLPTLCQLLENTGTETGIVGAILFDQNEAVSCRAMWEIARDTPNNYTDIYVSDTECAEVYILHHHEKAVACVPDDALRAEMLTELTDWADFFVDCSGYASEEDGEDNA